MCHQQLLKKRLQKKFLRLWNSYYSNNSHNSSSSTPSDLLSAHRQTLLYQNIEKYTLRLGADIWWTTYILVRDGALFMSFLFGFVYFYPDAMTEVKFAVPWYNVALVFVALTLLLKLLKDTDDDPKAHKLTVLLATLAALIHTGGTVFIFEAAHGTPLDWSVSGGFWDNLRAMFRSTSNLSLTTVTFWVTFALLGLIILAALIYIFTSEEKKQRR